MLMIQAQDLRRSFNGREAVKGISFGVEQGEVFGLLGPNGAGKSTTINVLTGQLLPTGWAAGGPKNRAKDKGKFFSNGRKQRLLIARALINKPQVLFLDEPTRGLDPGAARDIRQMVADLGRAGTTVFLTTHYMEEADQLCQRVAFIK